MRLTLNSGVRLDSKAYNLTGIQCIAAYIRGGIYPS